MSCWMRVAINRPVGKDIWLTHLTGLFMKRKGCFVGDVFETVYIQLLTKGLHVQFQRCTCASDNGWHCSQCQSVLLTRFWNFALWHPSRCEVTRSKCPKWKPADTPFTATGLFRTASAADAACMCSSVPTSVGKLTCILLLEITYPSFSKAILGGWD